MIETLTRTEVARILMHDPDWVTEHLLKTGKLPAVKVGRRWIILRADLNAYLEGKDGRDA